MRAFLLCLYGIYGFGLNGSGVRFKGLFGGFVFILIGLCNGGIGSRDLGDCCCCYWRFLVFIISSIHLSLVLSTSTIFYLVAI